MRRLSLSLLVLLLSVVNAARAQSVGIGYYDVDGLYDTIPSKFYDDSRYTPSGSYHWTGERYRRKVQNIAAVIDSMALDIVGLYGVEHEGVVRDIVKCCTLDYTFIHCTRNSFDGQDFALLYFGDKLFVEGLESVQSGRNMIAVEATLVDDTPITIILSRGGSDIHAYLSEEDHEELVVILGKLYQDEIDKIGYENLLLDKERQGEGNYLSARGYVMHDRVATNDVSKILKSGVYITPWLLSPDQQSPLPTYLKSHYKGGYSNYLPLFVYLK
ncbi:MAG: hypothetical protein SNH73_01265 [Rikenellaceae bacterium]